MPINDTRFLAITPEECEAEYWRVQFREQGLNKEVEDDDFESDKQAILDRLDAGDDYETIVDDLFGRDGKVA